MNEVAISYCSVKCERERARSRQRRPKISKDESDEDGKAGVVCVNSLVEGKKDRGGVAISGRCVFCIFHLECCSHSPERWQIITNVDERSLGRGRLGGCLVMLLQMVLFYLAYIASLTQRQVFFLFLITF